MIVNDFRLTLWGGAGASPGTFRNFCRNAQPCRCRQGFYDFSYEISCSDVVGRTQITVVDLARLELADAVIVLVPYNIPGAVIGQLGSISGVYVGDTDSEPVYLTGNHALYIPALPQMEPLAP